MDVQAVLHERRQLACVYIMTQALIALMQSLAQTKTVLDEATGSTLAQSTFDVYVSADLKSHATSLNLQTNEEIYARLLGEISKVRCAYLNLAIFESTSNRHDWPDSLPSRTCFWPSLPPWLPARSPRM